jgi:hypothetical protein
MRRLSNDSPEPASEVRLIAHTAAHGNFTQGVVGCQHQALSELYAAACEIVVCRDPEGGFERPAEVANTEVKQRREMFDPDCVGQMGIDMSRNASGLP